MLILEMSEIIRIDNYSESIVYRSLERFQDRMRWYKPPFTRAILIPIHGLICLF